MFRDIFENNMQEYNYKDALDNIAYLSIDMNVPNVDIKTAEYFWDKIVSGGIILLDDYCYSSKYTLNKKNFDEFAKRHSISIYQIPTGQGILIKQ